MDAFLLILRRDLRVAFRRWAELATPLLFFVIVASLLPLALSPEESLLRGAGTGFLWVAALLSSLLALDGLFRNDVQDGTLEQLALSPAPLSLIVLAKTLAHWLVSGVPLPGSRSTLSSTTMPPSRKRLSPIWVIRTG